MSHKSGHIIIQSLRVTPGLTSGQQAMLDEIEARDAYTMSDRLYLAWLTFTLASA